jgi:hypothetical protein
MQPAAATLGPGAGDRPWVKAGGARSIKEIEEQTRRRMDSMGGDKRSPP